MSVGAAPSVPGHPYAKSLYANLLEWYKDVHGRAQVVLTVDGAFTALLTGSVIGNRSEISSATEVFGPETWVFMGAMGLAVAVSLVCTVLTLTPRSLSLRRVDADFERLRGKEKVPPPAVMWWSQHIKRLGREIFIDRVATMDEAAERDALSSQIFALAEHLVDKYRLLYVAYLSTGLAFLLLLLSAGSYVIRIAAN